MAQGREVKLIYASVQPLKNSLTALRLSFTPNIIIYYINIREVAGNFHVFLIFAIFKYFCHISSFQKSVGAGAFLQSPLRNPFIL